MDNSNICISIVYATTLSLTPSRSAGISENTQVTLTCTTDEGNPTAVVVWTRDNLPVSAGAVSTESGQYSTQKRVSSVTVTATKTLNGAVYRCGVEDANLSEEYTMEVNCKYGAQQV